MGWVLCGLAGLGFRFLGLGFDYVGCVMRCLFEILRLGYVVFACICYLVSFVLLVLFI